MKPSKAIQAAHETTAFAYHLKQNLWLGETFDYVHLDDGIRAELDVAMAVRREGIRGKRTPSGILTQLRDTSVGRIVEQIEKRPNALAIDLGLQLLKLGSDAVRYLSDAIDKIVSLAAEDAKNHDVTVSVGKSGSGITVHCNADPDLVAAPTLKRHCEIRKFSQKATTWFGMIVHPANGALRLGLMLDYPWVADKQMDEVVEKMPKGLPPDGLRTFAKTGSTAKRKIHRNELCPCGSGLKYKKCCLHKAKG